MPDMNPQDYVLLDFQDIHSLPEPSPEDPTLPALPTHAPDSHAGAGTGLRRRDFLGRLGGGIIIFVSLTDLLRAAEEERPRRRGRRGGGGTPSDFNAFLHIAEDGKVTCFTGKIEMGQGPITSLPQMLADELDVPLESVDIVMGDTARCPWDMGTFGSMTTRFFGPLMLAAAAEARAVLLELASESLKVPQSQLVASDGVICDRDDKNRRVTYGELTKGRRIQKRLQGRTALKRVDEFKIIGKPLLRRDSPDKVTGKAQYSGDIRLPGMLYASILRPPAHGAQLRSVDTAPCEQVEGARVVREGDLIAVLHELPDVAKATLEKAKAEWDVPEPTVDDKTIFDHLLKAAPEARTVAQGGDLEQGEKASAKRFDSSYFNSYVAHAPMETHTALAHLENGRMTVWASTQNPFGAQREIASAIGFAPQNVRVITPFVGGGFGGKTENSQAVEAARLAKAAGKPVQVWRTREEEFFLDTFRPAAIVRIKSGTNSDGKIVFWDYDVAFAGERGAAQFYSIPNHRTTARPSGWTSNAHPFATGAWRAPGNNTNTFARESQIDMMAAAAGIDPVEFRLKNLTDSKMIRMLKTAADRFGWTPGKSPSKRGYGVACGIDAGTWVAAIAEVAVEPKSGRVQVKRVVCAQDMGLVVNPEGAKIQMEGCITMGLGYTLSEEVHFQGGKILDTNFDTYELPLFSWLPNIETVLIDSKEPPQGGGEPAIVVMGAVVANAIHDATGARLFQLPMTPERVQAAIAKLPG